ncbi:hypothetical protein ILUMI_07591 [Ignelater luminosus]|uniref:UDP-glucuronosyltransferase n=1 Tax=Ignelater luminosus TaxID=2038154 RepID=A0A8K0D3L0_IGNLU|nr:hypothetical protein ILUMI_07591 [Ignelater luminosus]
MKIEVFLITLFYVIISVENARILGIFHMPSYSHNIIGKTIFKALAKRGHQVTMISTYPLKPPMENYEDIYVDDLVKFKEEGIIKLLTDVENGTVFEKIAIVNQILTKISEICLSHNSVQNLLSSNTSFDLVMLDWALTDCLLGIAHHYKAPVIAVSAVGSSIIANKITSNPSPYSYVPNLIVTGSDEMDFIERVISTLSTIFLELQEKFYHEPRQDVLLHKFFPNAPPITDLIKNVSLVFLNSHWSYESPRPYVPNMIQIGGVHMEEPKALDEDLQKFMDDASEGVLYFSLGNNAKSEDLPKEKIESIVKTFARLPLKILWKVELPSGFKTPSNVKTGKWFSQADVLGHTNVKVFVTHGGLLSIIEALHRGVPMVGIPCFAEQRLNLKNCVKHGYAIMISLDELTEYSLYDAIMEILNDPRYQENIMKRSTWLKDQPIKPLDKAVFWVEYVLRHNGAFHLQTGAVKLEWYQYFLLDVIALLGGAVLAFLFIVWKTIKLLLLKILFKKKQIKYKKN